MSDRRVALVGDDGSVASAARDAGVTVTASVASLGSPAMVDTATPLPSLPVDDETDEADETDEVDETDWAGRTTPSGTQLPLDESSLDAIVAVGERALCETLRAAPGVPVLPVAVAGEEPPEATAETTATDGDPIETAPSTALSAFASGAVRTVDHRPVTVSVDGTAVGVAVLDTGLVTSEPARISEYSVHDGDRHVETVRSDAIVVSTPLGSRGYGRAAGGPVLAPGTGLAVTPVAPFATAASPQVLPETVRLCVERDEGDVSLLVDDRAVGRVPPETPVRVVPRDSVAVVVPTEG
ncbi:ATP-NAD kinase [Halobaculum sp. MBLA0147]|uniref:ATP-NAD kinase n=1 Tax=Halobaculum sp. MBLA0147 TaxID=3079934 RepID=UPI003523E8A6